MGEPPAVQGVRRLLVGCGGYVRVSGMVVLMRSKARRWVRVGVARRSRWRPAKTVVLRVRVARWSSRSRKLRTGWLSVPVLVRALVVAVSDRWAAATGWSRVGGVSSV